MEESSEIHPLIENINVRKLIQILKDIKTLKDAFPNIEISVKSNYTKIKIGKQLKYEHTAEVKLDYEENNWVIVRHNFPEKAASLLKIGTSINLKSAVEAFLLIINNLQCYFEALYIIDLNCIVLEPVEKSLNTTWRLIKYSKFAFIKIDFVDPLDINVFNVTFYGKDHIIKELNETYNSSSSHFEEDEEMDIYQKLCIKLKILEFPYTNKTEEDSCSICLCQHDDSSKSPIVCCENPKCDQLFHASCLSQHLNINCMKVLNIAVGLCPFCKQKISSNFAGFIQPNNNVLETKNVIEQNSMINEIQTQYE